PVVAAFPGQGSQRLGAIDAVSRIPPGGRAIAGIEGDRSLRRLERDRDGVASDPESLHLVLYGAGVAWAEALLGPVVVRGRALAACPPGAMLAVQLPEDEARRVADAHGLVVA